MSPESSIIQALIADYQDSIYYLLLGLSAVAFVVAEGLSFFKVVSEGRLKNALFQDPRAPFGWALVPAFLILLLAFVSWDRSYAPHTDLYLDTADSASDVKTDKNEFNLEGVRPIAHSAPYPSLWSQGKTRESK